MVQPESTLDVLVFVISVGLDSGCRDAHAGWVVVSLSVGLGSPLGCSCLDLCILCVARNVSNILYRFSGECDVAVIEYDECHV